MSIPEGIALSLRGLHKRFGATIAVDGLDLDVPTGSFYGMVGPNGAGKTTTLSMATGLLTLDAGTVLVHGVDLWAEPERAKVYLDRCPLRTVVRRVVLRNPLHARQLDQS